MNKEHRPFVKIIESRQNSLFKQVLKYSNNRRRREQELVWIENPRHLKRYLDSYQARNLKPEIQTLIASASYYNTADNATFLHEIFPNCREFALVSDPLIKDVAFCSTSKLIALVRWQACELDTLPAGQSNRRYLILDEIEKPGNLGAILRSCDGAGVDGVIVIGEKTQQKKPQYDDHNTEQGDQQEIIRSHCDLGHASVVQNSMGALFSVPIALASFDQILPWLKHENITLYLGSPEAKLNYTSPYDQKSCLLVGREESGISERWRTIEGAQLRSIPMMGVCDSLNVATSTAIFLYAMCS